MIQRVQSLLLLEVLFLSISLFFVPVEFIVVNEAHQAITLLPFDTGTFHSTYGHFAAIAFNICIALLALITLFLFKKRELQLKLCYLLVLLFVVLISMQAWCPFANLDEHSAVKDNIISYVIMVVGAVSSYLASRYVKKDIDLLKSADRIR